MEPSLENSNTHNGFDNTEIEGAPERKSSTIPEYEENELQASASVKFTRRFSNESDAPSTVSKKSVKNVFAMLSTRKEFWDKDSLTDSEYAESTWARIDDSLRYAFRWIYGTLKTAVSSPWILLPSLTLMALLCVGGIFIVQFFEKSEENSRRDEAYDMAKETGLWFSGQLDKALVPLFTMAQFVHELKEFHDVPKLIGDRCAIGEKNCTSAPSVFNEDGYPTHRDLNGTIDSELSEKYNQIASGIKKNSGLGRALVNLQLAPKAVVSFLYPEVNCDDFPSDICLDSSNVLGHDLLNDPNRVSIARATIPAHGVVTAGPLTLIQKGNPIVRQAFIARIAINMPGQEIVLDNVTYPNWGFAVVILNWEAIKDDSNIYGRFQKAGMQFKLTRTDQVINVDTGETVSKEAIIAESENASSLLERDNVSVPLNTTNNEWVMYVSYNDGFSPDIRRWAYPLLFCLSFLFMLMFMLILVSKKEHELLLYKMMPKKAIKKLRKGQTVVEHYDTVTIFFSDIVGYTSMTSEMEPVQVMVMLNQLYTEFDKLVDRHKLYKVETIGDAYMVIGGAPQKCSGPVGAEKVAKFALDVIECVKTFRTAEGARIITRCGLASGPVVAGVVGVAMPRYCLFGDTVNFASRMESTSKSMKIQVSSSTQRLLVDAPDTKFICEERKENGETGVDIKGKGRQITYWVQGAEPRNRNEYQEP